MTKTQTIILGALCGLLLVLMFWGGVLCLALARDPAGTSSTAWEWLTVGVLFIGALMWGCAAAIRKAEKS